MKMITMRRITPKETYRVELVVKVRGKMIRVTRNNGSKTRTMRK